MREKEKLREREREREREVGEKNDVREGETVRGDGGEENV